MKKPSLRRAARQQQTSTRARKAGVAIKRAWRWFDALMRWRRATAETVEAAVSPPRPRSNPMKHPVRKKAFDAALSELRKLFPNASEDFVRDMARRSARKVPVAKKVKPKAKRSVPSAPRERNPTNPCYLLPSTATKADRLAAHRYDMDDKKRRRSPRDSGRKINVRANLSRNHPDYGCTPAEHAHRKAGRNG